MDTDMEYFLFSVASYIIGIGSMVWFFWFLQFGIDTGAAELSIGAIVFNLIIFFIFPLQHSILARPAIKKRIHNLLPAPLERSVYVFTSGIAMAIVLLFWQTSGPELFRFKSALPFDIVFYVALILILFALRTMDHNSMFGLAQGYSMWKHTELPSVTLKTSGLYEYIRHPLTSLLIVALWSHESMTVSRLEFNILFTAYSIAGTYFEERDLVRSFGKDYLEYRSKVPGFVPRIIPRSNRRASESRS